MPDLLFKNLGQVNYAETMQTMQDLTSARDEHSPDQCWFLEHNPVFTLGLAGKEEHVLNAHDIPVVRSDRGGQVTYHGPGQLVVYFLWDLKRLNLNTRQFVILLEDLLINLCKQYGLDCYGDRDAPGVYCDGAKIASIGLRIKKQCTYHGIAINVNNDLTPFQYINPCGYANQKMIALNYFDKDIEMADVTIYFQQLLQQTYHSLRK